MNRLIIVGNGFDLAHGVKTSYKDFVEWYFGEVIESLKQGKCITEIVYGILKIFVYKGDLLKIALKDGYSKSRSMRKYTFNTNSNLEIIRNIDGVDSEFSIEYSPLFERIIKDVENKGWVDIEMDYYEILKDYALNKRGDVKQLNEKLSYIEKKLIEYLKEVENVYFSPNPLNDSKAVTNFQNKISKIIYSPFNQDEFNFKNRKFIEEHREYWSRNATKDKLRYKLYNLGYEYFQVESMLNDVENFRQKKNNDFPDACLLPDDIILLNFNYTSIADKYRPYSSIHIHGKLDDEDSVIFGYGDELDKKYKEIEELNDNEYLEKVKSVKYLEKDNYRKLLNYIESEPFQVYIMGHSCGNSDRTLLNTIFEHENCVSIKPFYYQKDNETDTYSEIIRNITRNFNNKQLLRERVVNKTYCQAMPQSEVKQNL
ncbi:MAG: AbiH family protein [Bacteroidales bacterium]|nr:AbiH family protein [Bacteroidales bacterium]